MVPERDEKGIHPNLLILTEMLKSELELFILFITT